MTKKYDSYTYSPTTQRGGVRCAGRSLSESRRVRVLNVSARRKLLLCNAFCQNVIAGLIDCRVHNPPGSGIRKPDTSTQ